MSGFKKPVKNNRKNHLKNIIMKYWTNSSKFIQINCQPGIGLGKGMLLICNNITISYKEIHRKQKLIGLYSRSVFHNVPHAPERMKPKD